MADFDETALRSPRQAIDSIRPAELEPWMVWSAAGAIAGMALLGIWFGVRGTHPMSGVGLPFNPGVAVSPAAAASATPAAAIPKDQQWSTLSGPEVAPPSAVAPKASAAAENDVDDASSETVASKASQARDETLQTSQPPPEPTSPAPASPAAPSAPDNVNPW